MRVLSVSAAHGAEEPGGPDGDLPAGPGSGAGWEWATVSGDVVPCAADLRDSACAGEAAAAVPGETPAGSARGGRRTGPADLRAARPRAVAPPVLPNQSRSHAGAAGGGGPFKDG